MNITDTQVFGFERAIHGMRNPMNSWDKSDSEYCAILDFDCDECPTNENCLLHLQSPPYGSELVGYGGFVIGKEDLKLAQSLILAGGEHSKFMRMIHVQADVDMPRYWWSEEDTYHFNTKNSCSTMHKLLNNINPITKDLFVTCEEDDDIVEDIVSRLEWMRLCFRESKDGEYKNRLLVRAKRLLPEGFLQMRTLDTNYAELREEYFQRRNHRLKEEWQGVFCKWVESLPYAKELIMLERGEN